jgi:hypothetical protein
MHSVIYSTFLTTYKSSGFWPPERDKRTKRERLRQRPLQRAVKATDTRKKRTFQ